MKALTLWQPYASLVAVGYKTIETRSWPTKHRGTLAIHAAARKPPKVEAFEEAAMWHREGRPPSVLDLVGPFEQLPLGKVVAIARLVDVQAIGRDLTTGWASLGGQVTLGSVLLHEANGGRDPVAELRCGDFTAGRFAWILEDVEPITPVAARGMQRLWNWQASE